MDTIDDANQYKEVVQAMKTMEMSQKEQDDLFAIVASVLHMGNVGFTEEDGVATILKPASVDAVASVIVSDIYLIFVYNNLPTYPSYYNLSLRNQNMYIGRIFIFKNCICITNCINVLYINCIMHIFY